MNLPLMRHSSQKHLSGGKDLFGFHFQVSVHLNSGQELKQQHEVETTDEQDLLDSVIHSISCLASFLYSPRLLPRDNTTYSGPSFIRDILSHSTGGWTV